MWKDLNIHQAPILGHSWGGIVAMEYALTQPGGIMGLTLSSTYANRTRLDTDMDMLRHELPLNVQDFLQKHEAAGTTDDPE